MDFMKVVPGTEMLPRWSNDCNAAKMHAMRRSITAGWVLCAALLALAGCQSTTNAGAVGVKRSQFMLISSEQLDQVAAQTYSQLKADATKQGTLNTDAALTSRVRAIAARLQPQTRVFRPDAPAWNWQVNVIDSKE